MEKCCNNAFSLCAFVYDFGGRIASLLSYPFRFYFFNVDNHGQGPIPQLLLSLLSSYTNPNCIFKWLDVQVFSDKDYKP